MEFLGKEVRGNVITPSHDNLEKVRNIPRPSTKKQIRSFSGMLGYYRYHIPAFADRDLITIDRPSKEAKSRMYQVKQDTGSVYSLLKEYLLQEPVLKLLYLTKPFVLWTDAFGVGVAAVLLQETTGCYIQWAMPARR